MRKSSEETENQKVASMAGLWDLASVAEMPSASPQRGFLCHDGGRGKVNPPEEGRTYREPAHLLTFFFRLIPETSQRRLIIKI